MAGLEPSEGYRHENLNHCVACRCHDPVRARRGRCRRCAGTTSPRSPAHGFCVRDGPAAASFRLCRLPITRATATNLAEIRRIACAVHALVTSTLPSEHPLAALGRRSLPHTPKLPFCPKPHPPPYPTSTDRTTSRGRASRADLLRRACRWRLGATRNVSFGGSFRNARA
jgi:hypothetical protein